MNDAGTPAVAKDSPGPDAVEVEPHVKAGNTVAVNGLPATAAVEDISLPEGIDEEMESLVHVRVTAAFADVSRYCSLMSYNVLLESLMVASFETAAGATSHKLTMY